MCVTSAVGDYWRDGLPQKPYWPAIHPQIYPNTNPSPNAIGGIFGQVTHAEFDALKRDVEELKKLLIAAKRFDESTGEPDCELESKVDLIKKLAALVGVSMDEIFGKSAG